ncbi:MAG: DUF2079 domain-containing protein [Spirochaetia bacterium]|nr:DUF2079 domain-containing protein [Spirochaetia bacterium]
MNRFLYFLSGATTLPFLLAVILPDPEHLTSSIERGICYSFLLAGLCAFFVRSHSNPFVPAAHLIIAAVLIVAIGHLILYTWSARTSLFLADQDITNISSAIANTASGFGLLPTAYVRTGDAGSYLGHHFAPALLLILPEYILGNVLGLDHFVYPASVLVSYALGLIIWIRLIMRRFSHSVKAALFASCLILSSFPLIRLGQSFHNEAFVIFFSGLLFTGLEGQRPILFFTGAMLWMMVKEDTSVYIGLLGLFLSVTGKQRQGIPLILISGMYFVLSHFIQATLGGKTGPDWTIFFYGSWPQVTTLPLSTAKPLALFAVLGSFAFLPLARPLFVLITIAPLALLHLFSNHPWHSTYYGHYVYAVLPFLMYGTLLGIDRVLNTSPRIQTALLSLTMCVAFYFNAGDRQTPGALFAADPEFSELTKLIDQIPDKYCIYAEANLSPLVPVNRVVFPLNEVEGNPNTQESYRNAKGLASHCRGKILLSGYDKAGLHANSPSLTHKGKLLKEAGRFSLHEIE